MTDKFSLIKKSLISAAICSGLLLTGCGTTTDSARPAEFQAAENALIPVEAIFDKSEIHGVSMSKDSKWIAFMKVHEGAQNLFVVPQNGTLNQAAPLTNYRDGVDGFQWSTNSNELFVFRDNEGNENSQIFRLSFEDDLSLTPKLERLTPHDDVNYGFQSQLEASPDVLVVDANHDERGRIDLFHLNMNTKQMTNVFINELGFFAQFIDDEGQTVLGANLNRDNSSTLYKLKDGDWVAVMTSLPGESFDFHSYDKETSTAYISADIQGRDKQELLLVDLTNDKITTAHKDPISQSDLHHVVFDKAGKPLIVSYYGGRLRNYPLTDSAKHVLSEINASFNEDVDILVDRIDHAQSQWHISVSSAQRPKRKFVYSENTKQFIDLLNQTPKVDPSLLGTRKSITYTASDGQQIQAYLTLPREAKTDLPLIVLPHGGPWHRDYWGYSSNYFVPFAHFFANRGYAVLQPNFRGSLGFGKRFTMQGERNWGTGLMQQDLTDGVKFLIERGVADPKRIGIMGASYGGYAALAGTTFTPDLYQAAISYVGPSSLITLVESWPEVYRPYLGTWFKAVGDPLIESDRQDMASRSPINFVDRIKTPLMLIQGANDPRVTQLESDNIARELHKTGRNVEYILAKDEGHGFKKHDNKVATVIAMEAFFATHLGGTKSKNVDAKIQAHLASLKVDTSKL
ncbi:S9 family peptidase [Pseudoalteromonas luteoviolacea]|uniref:S9 family peptidase n=1 Tax=Pseudoalteromonas luteoviolacea TaxID=43657 RepID=UPI001B38BB8A|nr:S9 family peptidase [Pseudoalteromonas luteoviolacea]MBQ4810545.1 S9 family peptidase [Pseudoalteromonas luteoviolacea]